MAFDDEYFIDNTELLVIFWTPEDLAIHALACAHAVDCLLADPALYSDGRHLYRGSERISRRDLRYDVLCHLDIRNARGQRILTPSGILMHVHIVLLRKAVRFH